MFTLSAQVATVCRSGYQLRQLPLQLLGLPLVRSMPSDAVKMLILAFISSHFKKTVTVSDAVQYYTAVSSRLEMNVWTSFHVRDVSDWFGDPFAFSIRQLFFIVECRVSCVFVLGLCWLEIRLEARRQ